RDDREQQNRRCVLQRSAYISDDAGLEHEERQKDVNERLGTNWQVDKNIGKRIGAGGPAELGQDGRKAPQRHSDHPEKNRRRQLQIGRERLAKPDDNEQRRDDEQDKSGVDHQRRSLLNPGILGGSGAALFVRILLGARLPGHRYQQAPSEFLSR